MVLGNNTEIACTFHPVFPNSTLMKHGWQQCCWQWQDAVLHTGCRGRFCPTRNPCCCFRATYCLLSPPLNSWQPLAIILSFPITLYKWNHPVWDPCFLYSKLNSGPCTCHAGTVPQSCIPGPWDLEMVFFTWTWFSRGASKFSCVSVVGFLLKVYCVDRCPRCLTVAHLVKDIWVVYVVVLQMLETLMYRCFLKISVLECNWCLSWWEGRERASTGD